LILFVTLNLLYWALNVDDWSENKISTKYKRVIGIVNCTEIPINTWQTNGCAILKYQVVILHATGKPLSVYGLFKRSIYDAKVYEKVIWPNIY
jgi:hypothetical protein